VQDGRGTSFFLSLLDIVCRRRWKVSAHAGRSHVAFVCCGGVSPSTDGGHVGRECGRGDIDGGALVLATGGSAGRWQHRVDEGGRDECVADRPRSSRVGEEGTETDASVVEALRERAGRVSARLVRVRIALWLLLVLRWVGANSAGDGAGCGERWPVVAVRPLTLMATMVGVWEFFCLCFGG